MATYVISDIHGEYGKFMELLDIIHFSDEDILYVLGDVVDRGKNPVKTLLKMMEMPNVIPIAGNHEQMMLECMSVLINEVKDENSIKEFAEKFSDDMFQKLYAWQRNGGIATTDELSKLDNETRKDVLDYVSDFSWYEKVAVNGQKYPLVHGGLGNFDIKRDIDDYLLDELVWSRVDYDVRYFDDVITVTGHTPTRYIEDNHVFTAIISVILLSSPSFSKYLRFLASNTIPEMPYALRHDLLSFSATSALCAAFKTLRWNARFQNRRYKNLNLLKIR